MRKGQVDVINLLAGLIVIAGGVALLFSYLNLGVLLAGAGGIIVAIKLTIIQGLR